MTVPTYCEGQSLSLPQRHSAAITNLLCNHA